MRIELRAAGKPIAACELGGPLLLPPPGTVLAARLPEAQVLEPMRANAGPDLLVGSLPLVWWDSASRSIAVEFLDVPAPPPFGEDDIESMWEALLASPLSLTRSVMLQGRGRGAGAAAGEPLASEVLPRALARCRRLLHRWPTSERREIVWRPSDMRGGREDLRATERAAARRGGSVTAHGVIPDRIARRQRGSVPWTSIRLARACLALARYLRAAGLEGSDRMLAGPLELVTERAMPSRMAPDPPLSSWPAQARTTFHAVIEALVGVAVAGRGEALVPLSDVWRMYESWIALRALVALEGRYGPGQLLAGGGAWTCEWDLEGTVVRLHSQREIGATPDASIPAHPDDIVSVSSNLRPDVMISVSNKAGDQVLICIDAKRRIEQTSMDAGDVAAAASKYLWGIRSASDPKLLPVDIALIVSSAGLAEVHDIEHSRIVGLFSLPSRGVDAFDDFVRDETARLVTEVDSA
jgi:hypothetical protein